MWSMDLEEGKPMVEMIYGTTTNPSLYKHHRLEVLENDAISFPYE